ncbi:uncharacterized protein LOC142175212 [Nicotiana tabacum]|uniref:Uncharacterized protein LOC142175212 n=1 Tax=Nicotiana tabacum TaxID=4097 RepID=A0AC58TKZ2_TOBAC
MARTMILEYSPPNHFWVEAVSTTCHVLNRCLIRPILKNIPYELLKAERPNIRYFHPFGRKRFVHNNGKDNLGNFDLRSNEGDEDVNQELPNACKTQKSNESTDSCSEPPKSTHDPLSKTFEAQNESTNQQAEPIPSEWRKPKKVDEALKDPSWIQAMQEELDRFEKNQMWKVVPKPANIAVIGTEWVFRNKLNEDGKVIRNKARQVAQSYLQEEGVDYDETFAPVARLESIRILLAYASFKDFKLF